MKDHITLAKPPMNKQAFIPILLRMAEENKQVKPQAKYKAAMA